MIRSLARLSFVLTAFLVLDASIGCAGATRDATSGALQGRILAGKSVEAAASLSVAIDAWVCAPDGETRDPSLLIGPERGLANVVVQIDVPGAPPAQADDDAPEFLIDQKGCVFAPHVSVVAPGQTLRVKNSDKVLHNFRTITKHNRAINKAQIGGKEDAFVFKTPEIIRAACDVHYWMSAVVVVKPHDFVAVTDESGRFSIEGLAVGSYDASLWHERLGTRKAAVTVSDEGGLLEVTWEKTEPVDTPAATPQ